MILAIGMYGGGGLWFGHRFISDVSFVFVRVLVLLNDSNVGKVRVLGIVGAVDRYFMINQTGQTFLNAGFLVSTYSVGCLGKALPTNFYRKISIWSCPKL